MEFPGLSFVIMKFTITAFAVLAALTTAVSGVPQPISNAERFARGLTPNPPANLIRSNGGTPAYST